MIAADVSGRGHHLRRGCFARDQGRLDEWLLYVMDSPSSSGARGLVRGRFFDREGRLVASVMQEGLMRQRAESGV